ncbi:MAG: hypothetical protein ABFC78_09240 [Methanoregula sp.]
MSQLIIETDTIKKAILYIFAIVGVLAIISMMVMGMVDRYCPPTQQAVIPAAEPVTPSAPTIVPTVVPTSAYPMVIEFTVLSTTVANGHYTVYTTLGQTLYMRDYYSWNSLWPRSTYTATITGMEANGALDVSTVNLISIPYNSPVYFHDGNTNTYWQWDGYTTDKISYKQVRGEQVIEGRPPYTSYSVANPLAA